MPKKLRIDGVNVLPVIRGEKGKVCTRRFWQWNRYTPLVTCNAAVRDSDWKLVRPSIKEAMAAPCCNPWLRISTYNPERLIANGLLKEPEPPRTIPDPPQPGNWPLVMSFRSLHPGGANFCMADGSVRFVSETIELKLYQDLSTRDLGEVVVVP